MVPATARHRRAHLVLPYSAGRLFKPANLSGHEATYLGFLDLLLGGLPLGIHLPICASEQTTC